MHSALTLESRAGAHPPGISPALSLHVHTEPVRYGTDPDTLRRWAWASYLKEDGFEGGGKQELGFNSGSHRAALFVKLEFPGQ